MDEVVVVAVAGGEVKTRAVVPGTVIVVETFCASMKRAILLKAILA